MQRYPVLTPLEDKSGLSLGQKLIDVAHLYNSCRADHNTLIDWIEGKQGGN